MNVSDIDGFLIRWRDTNIKMAESHALNLLNKMEKFYQGRELTDVLLIAGKQEWISQGGHFFNFFCGDGLKSPCTSVWG